MMFDASPIDRSAGRDDKGVMASDPTPYADSRGRTGLRTIILLALLAFAAGIAVTIGLARYYGHWLMTSPQTAGTAGAPSGGLGTMFVPPPEADSAPRTADALTLEARLAALSGRLGGLEARAALIDRDSMVAAGNAGRAESLLIAFAARRAIDRGLVLGYLEGQLRARFGAAQPRAVATIITASRNPVTVEDLRLSLDTIAPQLTTGGTSEGWWPSLHREITGLIVIRREGTPSPRPADRLQRIRRLLDARQVEAALAEVARLPGAGQAGAWTAAAGRYVDAHRALDLLETVAIVGPGQADPAAIMPQPAPPRGSVTAPPVSTATPAAAPKTVPTTATTPTP